MLLMARKPSSLFGEFGMSGNLPRVYWDACVFLAHLTGEECDAASKSGMIEWAQKVDTGAGIIMTSSICIVEVLEAHLLDDQK